jgi:homoserine kinase
VKRRARQKPSRPRHLKLSLPATSANLGPAFDAAALAFDLFLKIDAQTAHDFSVVAQGRDSEACNRADNHLIFTTYREVLRSQSKPIQPLALKIENEIPIGKGCGSSAAARLAGIALAVRFGRLHWNDARIVGEASQREHHADNAAACWMGGLAVARMSSDSEAGIASITPKGKWPLLLAVPDEELSTELARRVLPAQYSRADAVSNVQNSMLLLSAFVQGRPDLLTLALEDRLHEPFRAHACPLLPALQRMADSGILGVALSGAGPSVLIFLDPKANLNRVTQQIRAHLTAERLTAELIPANITQRGGRSLFGKSR